MTENDRQQLLNDIRKLIDDAIYQATKEIDKKVEEIKKAQSNLSDNFGALSEQFKRTDKTANDAKKISDQIMSDAKSMSESIMKHNGTLEKQIVAFEKKFDVLKTESSEQTDKLNNLIVSSEERSKQNAETKQLVNQTQEMVKTIAMSVEFLTTSDLQRRKKEEVAEGIAKKEEIRIETFWKRLPVILAITVTVAGLILWLFNALLAQNNLIKQQQNILQNQGQVK